jgi:hypothetical protein
LKQSLCVLALLLASALAVAQTLSEGSVLSLQQLPTNGHVVYDFELCCGIPDGDGGFLGNGFAYVDGNFTLSYRYPDSKTAYTVNATVNSWYTNFTEDGCTELSSFLSASVSYGAKLLTKRPALYYQTFCGEGPTLWSGPGGLIVF